MRQKIIRKISKAIMVWRKEGPIVFGKRTILLAKKLVRRALRSVNNKKMDSLQQSAADVLFINGCGLTHPARYRVDHQCEQLTAAGIRNRQIWFEDLTLDMAGHFRVYVFFRCCITDTVEQFILQAKALHKTVLYDIDDLVIDTAYTDLIPFLDTMSAQERSLYNDGVNRMQRTLRMCDGAITTTTRLATELRKYVPDVYINRNTASNEMLALSEAAVQKRGREQDKQHENRIRIGYFSGSITHNDDIQMLLPALASVLDTYTNVDFCFVGELDIPPQLKAYGDRIKTLPFVDWRKLPALVAGVDINIAPMLDTVFNEAKSENKWVEAALVKVPTVASNVGAMQQCIRHGETGFLCTDTAEWVTVLSQLIEDGALRTRIAQNAYAYVYEHCTTLSQASVLGEHIRRCMKPNIAFVLPSAKISGGVQIALRHMTLLQDHGNDVLMITNDTQTPAWLEAYGHRIPCVVPGKGQLEISLDRMVATLWDTVEFVRCYPFVRERFYLVQCWETGFYAFGEQTRLLANATYCIPYHMRYIAISRWIQSWLRDTYHQNAAYVPNGIDLDRFSEKPRQFDKAKITLLIEGCCENEYKNVDESFQIAGRLDKSRFHIQYLTGTGYVKKEYRYDELFQKVPHEQVGAVYAGADILLKTSTLEGFSLPPLEMMATGGVVVAVQNEGNAEYMEHEKNCLLYPQGDLEEAVRQIYRILEDGALCERLIDNGLKTAQGRDWEQIEPQILSLYQSAGGISSNIAAEQL